MSGSGGVGVGGSGGCSSTTDEEDEEESFWIVDVDGDVEEVDEDEARCAMARLRFDMSGWADGWSDDDDDKGEGARGNRVEQAEADGFEGDMVTDEEEAQRSTQTNHRAERAGIRRTLREQWLTRVNGNGACSPSSTASAAAATTASGAASLLPPSSPRSGESDATSSVQSLPNIRGHSDDDAMRVAHEQPPCRSHEPPLSLAHQSVPSIEGVGIGSNERQTHGEGSLEITLRKFGHTSFRDGQQHVIEAALSGRDALVVWPTDRGKSLCYQLPAVHMGKLVVVIEPNISLMDNQVSCTHATTLPCHKDRHRMYSPGLILRRKHTDTAPLLFPLSAGRRTECTCGGDRGPTMGDAAALSGRAQRGCRQARRLLARLYLTAACDLAALQKPTRQLACGWPAADGSGGRGSLHLRIG